jgi:hypothetical protein
MAMVDSLNGLLDLVIGISLDTGAYLVVVHTFGHVGDAKDGLKRILLP